MQWVCVLCLITSTHRMSRECFHSWRNPRLFLGNHLLKAPPIWKSSRGFPDVDSAELAGWIKMKNWALMARWNPKWHPSFPRKERETPHPSEVGERRGMTCLEKHPEPGSFPARDSQRRNAPNSFWKMDVRAQSSICPVSPPLGCTAGIPHGTARPAGSWAPPAPLLPLWGILSRNSHCNPNCSAC